MLNKDFGTWSEWKAQVDAQKNGRRFLSEIRRSNYC